MRRVAWALLAFAACDPSAPDALSPVDAGAPDASDANPPDAEPAPPPGPVGPLDLGMGDVRIGDVSTATVSVRNDGPAALYRVNAPQPCASRDGPFCARSQPDVIAEGEVFTFVIEYRPTPSRVGERERAELVIERGPDAPWTIVVDGRGTEAWPVRCFLPPARPVWLGEDAARFDLELCPRGDAPFEAHLRWRAAAAPGGPTTAGTSSSMTNFRRRPSSSYRRGRSSGCGSSRGRTSPPARRRARFASKPAA